MSTNQKHEVGYGVRYYDGRVEANGYFGMNLDYAISVVDSHSRTLREAGVPSVYFPQVVVRKVVITFGEWETVSDE